jgi:UDP-galactopyranose mutase
MTDRGGDDASSDPIGARPSWEPSLPRDLVCFSHLRWDFVYQRPNHLMARAARDRRVYFVEEPRIEAVATPRLECVRRQGLTVVSPVLSEGLDSATTEAALRHLMTGIFRRDRIARPTLWYYTPMALPWSRHLPFSGAIYDSMDYLAGFRGAPAGLLDLEAELLERVDAVFCGGASLHERMRRRRQNSYCLPSSVDVDHFSSARVSRRDPDDQQPIARPRIGYAGVIDERIDLGLIDAVALARPDWQIVLLGPTVKIDPVDVPSHTNIHRLGLKPYAELPSYLAGWDVGWMPFARNESTRYISPTKTPEYLAAGLSVVSTSITDVVEPYGRQELVAIADNVGATVQAVEAALEGLGFDASRVDSFLSERSWDRTWAAMAAIVDGLVLQERARSVPTSPEPQTLAPARGAEAA